MVVRHKTRKTVTIYKEVNRWQLLVDRIVASLLSALLTLLILKLLY